jgi:hypothetical protein
MKVDQIIGYFNQDKINLIPPFQRGTVWTLPTRQRLIANMIQARPIPAVFLYKQAAGTQFDYNILDGKQRLETLILFVGDRRDDLKVNKVRDYFFKKPTADQANFEIGLDGEIVSFKDVQDELVRAFREYAIPTIEIDLDDESTSIDEIVNLFIDINQYGVKVSRFDVVKALGKDPLFQQVFKLIALKQERNKSLYYRMINSPYSFVMKRLRIVDRLSDPNARVDRMWERLTEIALFSRTGKHRAPAEILKAFINPGTNKNRALSKTELGKLRRVFEFLAAAYRQERTLLESKLATDQPQFYTLVTSLLSSDILDRMDREDLAARIANVGKMIDGGVTVPRKLKKSIEEYEDLAAKQTTHPARRARRQTILLEAIDSAD